MTDRKINGNPEDAHVLLWSTVILVLGMALVVVLGSITPTIGGMAAVIWLALSLTLLDLYVAARTRTLGLDRQRGSAKPYIPEVAPVLQTNNNVGASLRLLARIIQPADCVDRISEHVQPLTRALQITSTHSVSGEAGGLIYHPATMQRKGVLLDDLVVSVSGVECAVLSQTKAAMVVMRAIDALTLHTLNGKEYPEDLRLSTFKLLAGSLNSGGGGAGGEKLQDVIDRYKAALDKSDTFKAIEQTLRLLHCNYCHLVPLQPTSDFTMVKVEYRIMQDLEKAPLGHPERWALIMRSVGLLRIVAGTYPQRWTYPLESAHKCASYHLTLMGPEGTYLSRQWIGRDSPDGKAIHVTENGDYFEYSRFRARLGQRYLHLYVRAGKNTLVRDGVRVEAGFFERPPGSVAVAAVSSLSCTALILAAGYIQARGGGFGGDMVAVMLAFPFVVASAIGFGRHGGPLAQGVLLARLGAITTATCSLIGAVSIIGFTPESLTVSLPFDLTFLGSSGSWIFLLGTTLLTSLMLCASWASRSYMYFQVLRRDALADLQGQSGAS